MADVEDKDMGQKKIEQAFYAADGLFARVGILSGAPKYPPKGRQTKGTSVAKVAVIQQARTGWMSRAIDGRESKFDAEFRRALDRLIAGDKPEDVLRDVAEDVRDDMRKAVEEAGLVETGLLRDTIKYRVRREK